MLRTRPHLYRVAGSSSKARRSRRNQRRLGSRLGTVITVHRIKLHTSPIRPIGLTTTYLTDRNTISHGISLRTMRILLVRVQSALAAITSCCADVIISRFWLRIGRYRCDHRLFGNESCSPAVLWRWRNPPAQLVAFGTVQSVDPAASFQVIPKHGSDRPKLNLSGPNNMCCRFSRIQCPSSNTLPGQLERCPNVGPSSHCPPPLQNISGCVTTLPCLHGSGQLRLQLPSNDGSPLTSLLRGRRAWFTSSTQPLTSRPRRRPLRRYASQGASVASVRCPANRNAEEQRPPSDGHPPQTPLPTPTVAANSRDGVGPLVGTRITEKKRRIRPCLPHSICGGPRSHQQFSAANQSQAIVPVRDGPTKRRAKWCSSIGRVLTAATRCIICPGAVSYKTILVYDVSLWG